MNALAANYKNISASAQISDKPCVLKGFIINSCALNSFLQLYDTSIDLESLDTSIIINPSFETAGAGGNDVFAGWTEVKGDGVIANEVVDVHNGAHAAKLTRGTNSISMYPVAITVIPGQTYFYSFYSKGDGTNKGSIYLYNNQGASTLKNIPSNPTTEYVLISGTVTIPAGCTTISLTIFGSGVNGVSVLFDDVFFQLQTSPIIPISSPAPFAVVPNRPTGSLMFPHDILCANGLFAFISDAMDVTFFYE